MKNPNRQQLRITSPLPVPLSVSKPQNNKILLHHQNKPKEKPLRGTLKGGVKQVIGKEEQKKQSIGDVLTKLQTIGFQDDFEKTWEKFVTIVGNYLKFKMPFPEPVCELGEELMKNGLFFACWLKILAKNQFICIPMIVKHIKQKYLLKMTTQLSHLQQYLKQIQPKQQLKTPQKSQQPLKRSILKNSQKKVQFGRDEIIYPTLESYMSPNLQELQMGPTVAQVKQVIRKKNGYLLDYFQINDIYLLWQVEIVGVIKEYKDVFAILQVQEKGTGKQLTCIAITTNNAINSQCSDILREIQRQFENLGYLELQGKSTNEIWVDCLPSETK